MPLLTSIPNYLVRFFIAILPMLGLSGGKQDALDLEPPTQELQMDVKKGSGLQPMDTRGTCDACPPVC